MTAAFLLGEVQLLRMLYWFIVNRIPSVLFLPVFAMKKQAIPFLFKTESKKMMNSANKTVK